MEQSVDSCRHSTIATWSSTLSFGALPLVGYYRAHTVGVRLSVTIKIRVRVRVLAVVGALVAVNVVHLW